MILRYLLTFISFTFLILPAQARHHHYRHHGHHHVRHPSANWRTNSPSESNCHGTTYDNDGRTHCASGFPQFVPSPLEGRGGAGPSPAVRHVGSRINQSSPSPRGGQGPIVTIATATNPITVASSAADRFRALIGDLVAHGFRGHVTCLASGHMPHSLHHTGEACDFAQLRRNVVAPGASVMYHASDIITAHGLRDGCSFHDCGHVDTGRMRSARIRHHRRVVNSASRPDA